MLCGGRRRFVYCPLYPQKRTLVEPVGMSALCQKRTYALQQRFLFDHVVGANEYGRLWITGKFMNRLLILGILIISTAPLFAQTQQPNAAELAQKVVSIISGDKV